MTSNNIKILSLCFVLFVLSVLSTPIIQNENEEKNDILVLNSSIFFVKLNENKMFLVTFCK